MITMEQMDEELGFVFFVDGIDMLSDGIDRRGLGCDLYRDRID
jgi:hypothetical protein